MIRRAVLAAALAVGTALAGATKAAAHQEQPGVRTVLDAVEPALPGVDVQVQVSAATQLVARNATPTPLVVLGADGEPFLRIGPGGVEANLRSPSWWASLGPEGGSVPADVDATVAARWAQVAVRPSWGWFDHRLHPEGALPTPAADGRLDTWEVPVRYGQQAGVIRGHRELHVVRGSLVPEVSSPVPGLRVTVVAGRLPALFAQLEGDRRLVLDGEAGEPFIRLGPAGAEVNDASPTWALTEEAQRGALPQGLVDAAAPPRWRSVASTPQITWLDRRLQPPVEEPADPSHPAVVLRWTIPAQLDDRPVVLAGDVRWAPRPPPAPASASAPAVQGAPAPATAAGAHLARRGPGPLPCILGAALVVLGALAVTATAAFRRRARHDGGGGPGGEVPRAARGGTI